MPFGHPFIEESILCLLQISMKLDTESFLESLERWVITSCSTTGADSHLIRIFLDPLKSNPLKTSQQRPKFVIKYIP